MKTSYMVPLLLALVAGASVKGDTSSHQSKSATLPAPTAYRVATHDANSRVWQRETYELGAKGQVVTRVHKYTELCSGLYYQDAKGHWQESQEQIESYPAGAIARQGPYQVIFANNLNSEGAVDVQTVDCKRLRSNILGLAYYDSASGKSVVIGEIQDCQGELISSNQVLYPHAFSSVNADVRYTYKRGSFEQDVILREQPPAPESFGLDPATTEIQVLTEFIDPPTAKVVSHAAAASSAHSTSALATAAGHAQANALSDDEVSWGATRMGRGKAFDMGDASKLATHVKVRRQYDTVQGRHILREGVPLYRAGSHLGRLPVHASNNQTSQLKLASSELILPRTPVPATKPRAMMMARAKTLGKGFVLDYVTVGSSETNMVFQGDTTYYVSGSVNLYGTAVFEGGTVIKFVEDANSSISSWDNVSFQGQAYRPSIFTSMNDDSVGEMLDLSSGNPQRAGTYLYLNSGSMVDHARFLYADRALVGFDAFPVQIWNAQFRACGLCLDISWHDTDVSFHNVLMSGCYKGVYDNDGLGGVVVKGEQLTVDQCYSFNYGTDAYLTNCIFTSLTNSLGSPANGNSTVIVNPAGSVYQTVGSGSYYLAANSPYRKAGTTNIDPAVLSDLAIKTTYPPVVYSNTTFSMATTLYPQALRDSSGAPDLGYHYDPLDYVFGASCVATANLTFAAGTAVGHFFGGYSGALGLNDNVTASFNGTVTAPCCWAKYSTVQEGNGNWVGGSSSGALVSEAASTSAVVQAVFTKCFGLADEENFFDSDAGFLVERSSHSEFYSGSVGAYSASLNLTNCLLVNGQVGLWENHDAANLTMQNCTMIRGYLFADNTSGGAWPVTIFNSAFDGTTFYMNAHGNQTNGYYTDYNAFLLNSNQTAYLGGHEVFVTNGYNWQSSWQGNFYLPASSPVIDAGSTTADKVGLYHFTTQTSQMKETNSIVDIGYHYVAIDPSTGLPYETLTNNLPDYLADTDGNGLPDWWEMQYFGHLGVAVNGDADGDGLSNLQEFLHGTNPNSADTDGDGMIDPLEIEMGRNAVVKEPDYIWFTP